MTETKATWFRQWAMFIFWCLGIAGGAVGIVSRLETHDVVEKLDQEIKDRKQGEQVLHLEVQTATTLEATRLDAHMLGQTAWQDDMSKRIDRVQTDLRILVEHSLGAKQ